VATCTPAALLPIAPAASLSALLLLLLRASTGPTTTTTPTASTTTSTTTACALTTAIHLLCATSNILLPLRSTTAYKTTALRLCLRCVNQLKSIIICRIMFEGKAIVLMIIIPSLLVARFLLICRVRSVHNKIGMTPTLFFLVKMRIWHFAKYF